MATCPGAGAKPPGETSPGSTDKAAGVTQAVAQWLLGLIGTAQSIMRQTITMNYYHLEIVIKIKCIENY